MRDEADQCVSPVAPSTGPLVNSEGQQIRIDSSSPSIIGLHRSEDSTFEGGGTATFSVVFSHSIDVVGGSPQLQLLLDNDTVIALPQWRLGNTYRAKDTLVFDFSVPWDAAGSIVELLGSSPLQLNGATFFRYDGSCLPSRFELGGRAHDMRC